MALLFPYGFICLLILVSPAGVASGQPAQREDKELCKHNLRLIYDAIQAYRMANKELPDSLSELFPKYLADPNVLFCPEARKRGLTSIAATGRSGFTDPKTSYFYEFSDVPLQDVPGRTNRDWKRAQMGVLGGVVPIVRCLVHDRPLNLSFGGDIYESDQLEWEYKFTNLVQYARLAPESLLTPTGAVRVIEILPRDPSARSDQVDLSGFYNGSLGKAWVAHEPTHNLASLPTGLRELHGTRYDIRGVIQLSSPGLARLGESFPGHVTIPLERSCHQLHFLLGTSLSGQAGAQAGSIDIRFADGQLEHVPLRIGTELGATWPSQKDAVPPTSATSAWRAQPPNTGELFEVSWTNPRPTDPIRCLECTECIEGKETADYFLVAVSSSP